MSVNSNGYTRLSIDERLDLLLASRTGAPVHYAEPDGTIAATTDSMSVDEEDLELPDGVGDFLELLTTAANPHELFRWFPARGC